VGFFRKRTDENELNEEALAQVMSGRDIHEGSPFYEKLAPEEGQGVELLFGRAGMAVASYVLSRSESVPKEELQAATMLFADAAAKAEFHLRCQKSDPVAVEAWLAGHQEKSWAELQRTYPPLAGSDRKEMLIGDARSLIDRNWEHVMTVATAYAASSIDIEGKESEFLDSVYYEPDD
jgi:hypothetical protein